MKNLLKQLFIQVIVVLIISQSMASSQEITMESAKDLNTQENLSSIKSHAIQKGENLEEKEKTREDKGGSLEDELSDKRTEYTPVIPKIEIDEAIDTQFPDPLSKAFRERNKLDDKEKAKSVAELLEEFEAEAAQIGSGAYIPEYIEDIIIEPEDMETSLASSPENIEEDTEATDEELDVAETQLETGYEDSYVEKEEYVDDSDDYTTVGISGEEIMVDDCTEPLPDMIITTPIEGTELIEEETKIATDKEEKEDEKVEEEREKPEILGPVLLAEGDPAKDQSELTRIEILEGVLVPEVHPISKRNFMFRWAVRVEEGELIPIRSNLKVLKTVSDEELLDSEVEVKGHYQTSALNPSIRYFIATDISAIHRVKVNEAEDEAETEGEEKPVNEVETSNESREIAEGEARKEIASETKDVATDESINAGDTVIITDAKE